MKAYINVPNCITGLRILGTLALLFIEPLSIPFYVVYMLTGVTDVLDGMIARLTHTTTELGSRLDSIADLSFYAVLLIRILPALVEALPEAIWFFVAAVIVVRIFSYGIAFIKYKRFASVHTYMNKVTGASIFCYPFFLFTSVAVPVAFTVCSIAALASVEELIIHLISKKYSDETRTIFSMR